MRKWFASRSARAAVLAVILAGGAAGVAYATGALVGGNGVVQGCYDNGGNVKVVSALPCPKGYTAFSFYSKSGADSAFLTQSSASSTYLTKTDASSTYLTQTDAASNYLGKTDKAANSDLLDGIDSSGIVGVVFRGFREPVILIE